MSEELHQKILLFLGSEFARKEGRQCIKLELSHAQPGYRGDELRTWHREEDPGLFDDLSRVEKLTTEILEKATEEADGYGTGSHRFVLRTQQYLGGHSKCSFSITAGFSGEELVGGGGQGPDQPNVTGVLAMQMRHNERHMQTQAQMFHGTIQVLSRQNTELAAENAALRQERNAFYRQLEEASSHKDERDLKGLAQIASDNRKDKAMGKMLQLAPVVASRLLGKDTMPGAQSPLAMLVNELGSSLEPSQIMKIAAALKMEQQVLFMEAMRQAKASQPAPDAPTETTTDTATAT
jgi:hypothetical protein